MTSGDRVPANRGANDELDPTAESKAFVAQFAEEFTAQLGIPGVADVHSHFMPESVMNKVWQVFDNASAKYGMDWPIRYRVGEAARVELLRSWGVRAFTTLTYAHKPEMARWLNEWTLEFARRAPDCIPSATFFPEDGVDEYVAQALDCGAKVFKLHLQVSGFDPRDPVLQAVWGLLQDRQIPVVIHCASGPIPGRFTGPGPLRDLLASFPQLSLIIAHLGAPEYADFMQLTDEYPGVRLDTTMTFTDFMEELAPFPVELRPRLLDAGLRGDVLFGSDFPNIPYSYDHGLQALVRLDLGDEWLRQVVWRAAARQFQLDPGSQVPTLSAAGEAAAAAEPAAVAAEPNAATGRATR